VDPAGFHPGHPRQRRRLWRDRTADPCRCGPVQVKEIAYDPWNATHIALRLQDEGATMMEFRQGFRSMAAPTRELEKLIVSRKLAHGGNPVTRWMAANVAVAQDPAGNLKPAKDKSTERIDGIVATIMAIGRAMIAQEEPQPEYQMFFLR
jgi:phage terminase large subunit-like protein